VVYGLCLAIWVGSIAFFSFGVAPIIFNVLPAEHAAKFVRALFPRYYAWGVYASGIALPALILAPLANPELRGPGIGLRAMLILASLLIFLYCGNSLTPAINAARDAGDAQKDRFDRLHKRSVYLNSIALLIGIGLLVTFSIRQTTKTAGIAELTPQERTQYDLEIQKVMDDTYRKEIGQAPLTDPAELRKLTPEARAQIEQLFKEKLDKDAEKFRKRFESPKQP
jgi:hypothetical protein